MPQLEPTQPLPDADPTPLDELTAQLVKLEAATEAAEGWDIDPQMFLWQPPVLAALHVPPALWRRDDNHPAMVLRYLAADWAEIKAYLIQQDPALFGADPQGIVLSSEGWGFDMAAVAHDPLKTAEYERVADMRRISVHPDRVEVRTVLGVHADGTQVMVTRLRGRDPMVTTGREIGGLVADAMAAFVATVTRPGAAL